MRKKKMQKLVIRVVVVALVAVLGYLTFTFLPALSPDDVDLVRLAFSEKYNKSADEITLNVGFQNKNHMRGMVQMGATPGEAGVFLAAKVDDVWKIVYDGNGSIPCALGDEYGFPVNMLDDCAP